MTFVLVTLMILKQFAVYNNYLSHSQTGKCSNFEFGHLFETVFETFVTCSGHR